MFGREGRVVVEKRPAELGAVEVRTTVETEQQTVPVELARDPARRPVAASDGRLGTLEEGVVRLETGDGAYLVVCRGWTDRRLNVAATQVDGIEAGGGSVHLRGTRDQAKRLSAGVARSAAGGAALSRLSSDRLTVPILAERLTAETRPVDLGELRVHKRLVLKLKEEVRIRRRPVTEALEVRETLRKERIEVEDATRDGIGGPGAAGKAAAPERPHENPPGAAGQSRKEAPPAPRRTRRGQGQRRDQKPSTR